MVNEQLVMKNHDSKSHSDTTASRSRRSSVLLYKRFCSDEIQETTVVLKNRQSVTTRSWSRRLLPEFECYVDANFHLRITPFVRRGYGYRQFSSPSQRRISPSTHSGNGPHLRNVRAIRSAIHSVSPMIWKCHALRLWSIQTSAHQHARMRWNCGPRSGFRR